MEYTVLTCLYRIHENRDQGPGDGPYSKQVTRLLADGWEFRGEVKMSSHIIEKSLYVVLVQEFIRTNYEEPYK